LSMLGSTMSSAGFQFSGNVSCGNDICSNYTAVDAGGKCAPSVDSWFVNSAGDLVEFTSLGWTFLGNSCSPDHSYIQFFSFEQRAPSQAEIEGALASEEATVCNQN
jgi:hypothetical protein